MDDTAQAEDLTSTGPFKLKIPKGMEEFFLKVAGLTTFAWRFMRNIFKPPYEVSETIRQFSKLVTSLFHWLQLQDLL